MIIIDNTFKSAIPDPGECRHIIKVTLTWASGPKYLSIEVHIIIPKL